MMTPIRAKILALFSPGIHNPARQMRIALAVTLLACCSVGWGVWLMRSSGTETLASGLMIGLALLPALIGPFVALNFWWAMRVETGLRRGEGVVGRWQVTADALARFLAQNAARDAHGPEFVNDWHAPLAAPLGGVVVLFGKLGVLVDDTYFPLTRSGLYKFTKVGILPDHPLSIEFVTVATHVGNISAVTIRRFNAVLRLPIDRADCPQALAVLAHYRGVLDGSVSANPGFYQRRLRIGLIGAGLFVPLALAGYLVRSPQAGDAIDLPVIMMAVGGVFSFASLLLAILAWLIGRRKGLL